MKRTVVLAVAGTGNRLATGLPKCMIKIAGRHIFEYQLKAFEIFDEIRMVVGYKADMVKKTVTAIKKDIVFIENKDYLESSSPLYSFFLGKTGLEGKVLFSVGDIIYSFDSAKKLFNECSGEDEFIGITSNITENPIFADVQKDSFLIGLSREKKSNFEFAGSAFIDCSKVENNKTFFFEQLNHYMPFKVMTVERLEVDTKKDFADAENMILKNPDKYNFWKQCL
jgi:choline kinase